MVRLDDLEQYSRKNSLEIVGIPESIRDNEGAVLKIANALNVQVHPEDIDICHRVERMKSRPIVLRLVSHKVKSYPIYFLILQKEHLYLFERSESQFLFSSRDVFRCK